MFFESASDVTHGTHFTVDGLIWQNFIVGLLDEFFGYAVVNVLQFSNLSARE